MATPGDDRAARIAALPPGVARAWGLDERPRRGPRPGLSLEAITSAAVELADQEGLDALSMSRIAGRLGYTTMSLYRYVDSKDELLTLLLDAITPSQVELPGGGWRPALREWGTRQLRVLLAHPWVLSLPMPGPPLGPHSLAWVEAALAALADTPLEPWERMAVVGLVSSFSLSEARLAVQATEAAAGSWGQHVALLADPDRLPALTELVASGQLDGLGPQPYDDPVDDFTVFGLERILDGVQSLIERRATSRG